MSLKRLKKHNRKHYTLSEDGQSIMFKGKLVPRKATISLVVNEALDITKGYGVRKMYEYELFRFITEEKVMHYQNGSLLLRMFL